MKQVIQNYKTGELKVVDVPIPSLSSNSVIVKTYYSLVSAGTERMKIKTAKMNIIEKAKTRPDDVRTVLNNIKQEGLYMTYKKAMNKLNTPITLGYSCSGEVIEVGKNVDEFKKGDMVCCIGEGYATHSEFNSTPSNFCVKIPKNVLCEEAAFGGVGAIALEAIRQARIETGCKVVLFGLGLTGLITVQILKASGVKVFGIDINIESIELAKKLGMDDGELYVSNNLLDKVMNFTNGFGADSVIIAAASSDKKILDICGEMCCEKGNVVVLGVVPLTFSRKNFYSKELSLSISRAFGAGTYDFNYYSKGIDYPHGYVKWTAKRNVGVFLDLIYEKKIKLDKIISHRFDIEYAEKAYDMIREGKERYIGVLFTYKNSKIGDLKKDIDIIKSKKRNKKANLNIGFIGAGSFGQGYILPYFRNRRDFNLRGVATSRGISASSVMQKFDFEYCTTNYEKILDDEEIGIVFILTRHNLHTKMVVEALKRDKIVFVEKPLAIDKDGLKEIIKIHNKTKGQVMVGYNRRFSPLFKPLRDFYKNKNGPLIINYRINAGFLPPDHWTHDKSIGGGRIIGEVCHFIDTMQCLTSSNPVNVFADVAKKIRENIPENDNVAINIKFEDGSIGIINYNSIGDVSFPRERIEVFGENSVGIINNFKHSLLSIGGKVSKFRKVNRDMGYSEEINVFLSSIKKEEDMPISFNTLVVNTYTTFKILDSIREGEPVKVNLEELYNE